jgi:methyl-accepting chemotaxis protein
MRTNQPVTNHEVLLEDGEIIVSKTDLQGRIIYVNHTFLEISGFTEKECIGEPHNMVRHPDMPAEAFADLWNNLKQGRPWSGYVKNRCKNGDHYWVKANATPLFENGQVVGYMSVREKPNREAVTACEAAYAKIRAGNSGLVVVEGQALADNKLKLALRKLTVAQRVIATLLVLLALLVVQGMTALGELKGMEHAVKSLYEEHVAEIDELKVVVDLYAVNIVDTAHKARNGNISHEDALKSVSDASKRIAETWGKFAKGDHPPEERVIVDKTSKTMAAADVAVAELVTILKIKDEPALAGFTINKLYPAIDPVSDQVGAMITEVLKGAKQEYEQTEADYAQSVKVTVGIIIGAVVLAIVLGLALLRAVRRPVDSASEYFRKFAEGRLDFEITINQRDEMSAILDSAKAMQVKLGFDMVETRRVADEMTRIKIALDGAAMPITISNPQDALMYMNGAAKSLWEAMAPSIRSSHPDFTTVDAMIGGNLVNYIDDEAMKATYRAELSGQRTLDVGMGGKLLRVTATPVRDEKGNYLGRASQWVDRTLEIAVENEVGDIVSAAAMGDLSKRLAMEGKVEFFASLSAGINQLLETTHEALTGTSEVLSRVAQGDLTKTIDANYSGIFGQLKDDTNSTIERLREVVGRIKEATEAINTASQEIAAGNTDLSSRTEEQASSLEETASSMEELNATVKANAENARQGKELSQKSNDAVVRGGQMVKQVVTTMSGIQESSKKIADIIGVIDSIAFQTNILALNAAVEAARAGEQGRGFAVVATEVRNLAQRSATAAKEIKMLIAESVDQVENGAKLVHQAGDTMDEVVVSFQQVASLVTEIANASREQSSGIEQVTQAVGQMDEVTQQNAALVEQAAAAAESLEEQARGLVQSVGMFTLVASQRTNTTNSNLPGPALRDATPRRLTGAGGKVGAGGTAQRPGHTTGNTAANANKSAGKQAPPHLASEDEEWEEF